MIRRFHRWLGWIDNHILKHRIKPICRWVHINWWAELTPAEIEWAHNVIIELIREGEIKPISIEFDDEKVYLVLSNNTRINNPLSWHSWLDQATPEQRTNYVLGSESVLWPDLDEGLDIEGMLRGINALEAAKGQ